MVLAIKGDNFGAMDKVSVLFVCLGNICRSPMAEGLFIEKVNDAGLSDRFIIDSAGTGDYHIGELPDPRMRETARQYGIELNMRARQVTPDDLDTFDHVLAMDDSNLTNIEILRPDANFSARLELMRNYDPMGQGLDVPDPYFGGDKGFHEVYHMLDRATEQLLNKIIDERLR